MLEGSIKYNDEDLGVVSFQVLGKHSVNSIMLHMQPIIDNNNFLKSNSTANLIVDKAKDENGNIYALYKDGVEWETSNGKEVMHPGLWRDVVIKTDSGKVTTNLGNLELATRLGAIVTYCKQNAKGKAPEDVDFSDVLYGHLDKTIGSRYKDIEVVCDIEYKQSEIVKLKIESPYFSIDLGYADENDLTEALFKPLKQKDKWNNIISIAPIRNINLKYTKSSLGWEVEQRVKKAASILGMYQNIEDVIEAHPEKNTSWILNRKYEIVTDETVDAIIKEFMDYDGYIAFDTETTGLKINFQSRDGRGDQLVGCVLSKEPGTGYYFPLQHKYIKNLCGGDHYFFMNKYMKPLLENKQIVTHNCKYDWKVAYIYGIVVNVVFDTMIAFGVTKRYEILNFELGLKSLAASLLGLDMFDLDDFIIGENEWGDDGEITFADLPYELVRRYAPADGDMTLSLMQYIIKHNIIQDFHAEEILKIEIEFSKVVAYSEFWGYHIDVQGIPELKARILKEMEEHQQAAYAIAGHEFNMNSPVQLNQVMYGELMIEMVDGKPGTDKNILKTLAEKETPDGEPMYPFVRHLKAYRDVESIYKNFLKRLKEFSTEDGYIFPDVMFLGTETGRCAVKNPNYQSYNDTVKHYVVPRQGYIMGDSDFGQIEYRTLASMAPEPTLIKAFDDPDLDYHQYQASRMFNVPYAAVTKKLRQQSKGINFGLPYGMGDQSLGIRIFGAKSPENTKKAAKLREKFFEGQDNIRAFFDRVRDEGVKNGYTSTLKGRRRYYHKGKFTVAEIRRQAGNHVIQGSAADIYKMAVIRFFHFIMEEGLMDKVLINAFIHDEILFEVHESIDMLWFTTKWREAFEVPIEGFCKLYAGLGYGNCWYDAKKQDLPTGFITALCELAKDPKRASKDFIFDNVDPNVGYIWHGDKTQFIKDIKYWFKNYKFQRVYDYFLDASVQGEIIKPAIWALLTECSSDLIPAELELKNKGSAEDKAWVAQYIDKLKKCIGDEKVIYNEAENKIKIKCKELEEYIKVFCLYKGIDYLVVNIKSPTAVEVKNETKVDEAAQKLYSTMKEIAKTSIDKAGIVLDAEMNRVYANGEDNVLVNLLKPVVICDNGTTVIDTDVYMRLEFICPKENKTFLTKCYLSAATANKVLEDWILAKGGRSHFGNL